METLSATQYLQQRPEPLAGRKRGRTEPAKVSTTGPVTDGFLNHRFLPLYEPCPSSPERTTTEKRLFASLKLLEKVYAIATMDVSDKPYPYNVLLAHWDTEQQLGRISNDTELLIINDEGSGFKFATRETLDTEMHLYHIPLLPLHRLIESGRDIRSAELLLSVCAYLYHGAGIPHYRDEDSFLHYHYEMLTEDLDPEWSGLDSEEIAINKSILDSAVHFGDIMQRRLHNPCHLELFGHRVKGCRPKSQFHRNCLRVAMDTLKLWQDHPTADLLKNADNSCLRGTVEEDDEEEDHYEGDNTIAIYEYVHFVAEIKGVTYNNLCEMVNSEFREKMYTQEPAVITRFDDNLSGDKASLDYERRLFKLINDLTTILDELP